MKIINPPKFRWYDVADGLPTTGPIYNVYAEVNIGTPHQCFCVTQMRRVDIPCGWADLHGDPIDDECTKVYAYGEFQ